MGHDEDMSGKDRNIEGWPDIVYSAMLVSLIMVMVGGAVGSALRFLVGLMMPTSPGNFPVATLIINLAGSAILGAVSMLSARYDLVSKDMALLLGTGLCGGFTTFSTFSVELMMLVDVDRYVVAALYLVASTVGGITAAFAGAAIARMAAS